MLPRSILSIKAMVQAKILHEFLVFHTFLYQNRQLINLMRTFTFYFVRCCQPFWEFYMNNMSGFMRKSVFEVTDQV